MGRVGQIMRGIAALLGAAGVLLGAFGAHALRDGFNATQLALWQTAVSYLFWHVLAALLTLSAQGLSRQRAATVAAALFLSGIVVFSGSLFALALAAPRWIGALTPIGGAALILGWLMLVIACLQKPVALPPER